MVERLHQKTIGTWRRRVIVMVRDPVAGAVKTRLARGIGTARATSVYRHTSGNVIARLAADQRWDTGLAVTPDPSVNTTSWSHRIPRLTQGTGDLGRRMQRVFDTSPPGPVIIIGTDIPEIDPNHIAYAFAALGPSDVVFGPADDGGYWLIGLARNGRIPQLFHGVRWSSEHTLADTQANVADLRVTHLSVLDDVDDAEAFSRIGALGGRRILPVTDYRSN